MTPQSIVLGTHSWVTLNCVKNSFSRKGTLFLRKGLILSLKLFIRIMLGFNILELKLNDINLSTKTLTSLLNGAGPEEHSLLSYARESGLGPKSRHITHTKFVKMGVLQMP